MRQFIDWIGISESKFYHWKNRYGKVNEHNGWIPRDFWLEDWEKEAIIEYYRVHPTEGYRRLTYMMMDADIVAVSPSSVWRVLHNAGLLKRWNETSTGKGKGFHQPHHIHDHWHIDVSYLNIRGTFYYMCSILDGYSRYLVHWDIKESMTAMDVEIILQRARERFPGVVPSVITDNGPQFISRDFKELLRISGMKHVRCSPYYPQSNGKIERYHRSVKSECIRKKTPLSLKEAQRIVGAYVNHYNNERLHSSIGYISPKNKLEGRENEIFTERDRKLEEAREKRKRRRQMSRIDKNKQESNQRQCLIMAIN
jgi:transposase InsO family protein